MPTATKQTPEITVSQTDPNQFVFDLTAKQEKAVAELAEARLAKSSADKRAEDAKAAVKAIVPVHPPMNKGQKLVAMFRGKPRLVVSPRSRTNIDGASLMDAFPEAFAACSSTSYYEQADTV